MESSETYSLFMATDVACRILRIDPQMMLKTAGLGELARSQRELRVTAALGLSRSTLQRRLREAGTSYQEALDAMRQDIRRVMPES